LRSTPVKYEPEYETDEEGQYHWCGNLGPVNEDCNHCPNILARVYFSSNEINHPLVPQTCDQNYFINKTVIQYIKKFRRENELKVFWEVVQEILLRRFMENNFGTIVPEFTFMRDRMTKCKWCNLTMVPQLISRLSFFSL
jgi:hypothetical protein